LSTLAAPPRRRGDTVAAAIATSGLVKTFGPTRALDGLDLTVATGEVHGFLGPNGAGKSTTVKVLTTLARPDSGSARVDGIDVLRDPAKVRRAIGCVSQKAQFDPEATGRENLILQGQVVGALYAYSRAPGKQFTELDLELLEAIAGQAAFALGVGRIRDRIDALGRDLPASIEALERDPELSRLLRDQVTAYPS
jgi:ABC-type Na+ transport system ATPase subunit NatA